MPRKCYSTLATLYWHTVSRDKCTPERGCSASCACESAMSHAGVSIGRVLNERVPWRSRVLHLYKAILRLHRALPPPLRLTGDTYVRHEFRRHKHVGRDEALTFVKEWAAYQSQLSSQVSPRSLTATSGVQRVGGDLCHTTVEALSDEQLMQLYELRQAAYEPQGDRDAHDTLAK